MNTDTKNALLSKTLWGAVISLIAMFFPHALSYIGISDPTLVVDKIVAGIGFALTIYGRIRAKQPLNLFGSSQAGSARTGSMAVAGLLAMCLLSLGCNATSAAQKFSNVFSGILSVAQADEPALPAVDASIVNHWVTLGQTLDAQLNTCITITKGNKAKIAGCITAFGSGLTSPAELAQLRILTPGTQTKIQVVATAVVLAVNAALAQFGGPPQATPAIAAKPATSAELKQVAAEAHFEYKEFPYATVSIACPNGYHVYSVVWSDLTCAPNDEMPVQIQ